MSAFRYADKSTATQILGTITAAVVNDPNCAEIIEGYQERLSKLEYGSLSSLHALLNCPNADVSLEGIERKLGSVEEAAKQRKEAAGQETSWPWVETCRKLAKRDGDGPSSPSRGSR